MDLTDRRGFTLLEMLVALAASAIVSLAGWSFYRHELHDLSHQSANLDASEALRAATAFLSREIRAAAYDPTLSALDSLGDKGIAAAGPTTLHLERDADGDGAIDAGALDPDAESILYTYDVGDRAIRRTVAGAATTLVENVPPGTFSFQYFDLSGASLPVTGSPPMLDAASRDRVATVVLRVGIESTIGGAVFEAASRVVVRARALERL